MTLIRLRPSLPIEILNMNEDTNSENEVEVKPAKVFTNQLDTGNFSIIVSGTVREDYKDKCIKNGLTYDMQRGPATKCYVALAGVPAKKKDVLVLPEGFKRESVVYSEANAALMKSQMEKEFGDKLDGLKVVVFRHVVDEKEDGRTRAKTIYARWVAEGKLEVKVAVLDYTGKLDDEDAIVEAIHAFISARTQM